MFYNLRKKINLSLFNARTAQIRQSARVKRDPSSKLTIVTLLCDSDINMYLLALSSFTRYVKARTIVIVSDNLSEENQKILRTCVEGIKIVPVEEYREPGLPVGGCWERLTYIIHNVSDSFVMQLDADTITVHRPAEVIQAIEKNESFSIVANENSRIMSLPDIYKVVGEWQGEHVQVKAEQALKDFKNAENRKYVRACAAFTGFARGSCDITDLKAFSMEMEENVGKEKWSEWGSEQVASNYLIANTEGASLLPFKYYPFYRPDLSLDKEQVKVFHFIGSHRFKKGYYLSLARKVIGSI